MTNLLARGVFAATPAGLVAAQAQPTATCTPCIDDVPRLVVDADGSASAPLRISNRGATPLRLALTLSDFAAVGVNRETIALNTTRRVLAVNAADSGAIDGTADLSPGCVPARLEVSGLWQAGLSTAVLSRGPTKLADVQAVRLHAPFGLKVDGPNPEKKQPAPM